MAGKAKTQKEKDADRIIKAPPVQMATYILTFWCDGHKIHTSQNSKRHLAELIGDAWQDAGDGRTYTIEEVITERKLRS